MPKTRIYVDVDGVINAFPGSPTPDTWKEWETEIVMGYSITYSPEVVDALEELSALPDTEVVWLTTWQNHAAVDLSPAIGLRSGETWRVIDTGVEQPAWLDVGKGTWWKHLEIVKDLQENPVDRVVWLDDDHNHYLINGDTLGNRFEATAFYLVTPYTHTGLTPEHIRGIIDFINGETE